MGASRALKGEAEDQKPQLLLGGDAVAWLKANGPFYTKDELIMLDVRRERSRMLTREQHLTPPHAR